MAYWARRNVWPFGVPLHAATWAQMILLTESVIPEEARAEAPLPKALADAWRERFNFAGREEKGEEGD